MYAGASLLHGPLRASQTSVSTVVGRLAKDGATLWTAPDFTTETSPPNTKVQCLTTRPTPITPLMHILSAHGRRVLSDNTGVSVKGSFHPLPWREHLSVLVAIISALAMTKAFFDAVRFELLHYGVWRPGYNKIDSFTKRMRYYGSTALLAAGLPFSFSLNFFLSAWVVERRETAAHFMCNGVAHVVPRHAVQLIERRLKLSFVQKKGTKT